MKFECIAFDEGQGTITLDIDEEAKQFLLEYAVNDIIRKGLEIMMEANNGAEVSGVSGDCSPAKP
jgi:hypothetical protein